MVYFPQKQINIGIIGSGFIAKGFHLFCQNQPDLRVSYILTRSNPQERTDFLDQSILTNNIFKLFKTSDIIFECTGDVIYATQCIKECARAKMPVVTMNSEFHTTCGSYFNEHLLISEALGDQPGTLAAFSQEIIESGFTPLVYGNIKKYLKYNPSPDQVSYWARKQGISIPKTIAFTDGTKVEIENVLVANGLGTQIVQTQQKFSNVQDCIKLGKIAAQLKTPISQFIVCKNAPAGVFIIASHNSNQKNYLNYLKLGKGPYYLLLKPYHLCHLDVAKTIRSLLTTHVPLLQNKTNTYSVAAISKKFIKKNTVLDQGIGNYFVRGKAVKTKTYINHVPIGLLNDAIFTKDIPPHTMITFNDVFLPFTLALEIWRRGIK